MNKLQFKVEITFLRIESGKVEKGSRHFDTVKTAQKNIDRAIIYENDGINKQYGRKMLGWKIIDTITNEVIEEGE